MSLLAVRGLSVEYVELGAVNRALNAVDIDVPRGGVVGVVGESGSGKTTLALAILGVTRGRGRIVAGSVEFDGEELLGLTEDRWRDYRGSRIGLITQNPRSALNPVQRVGDQLAQYYRSHRAVSTGAARERALELLALVGINDPERRFQAFPHELSGGMAQRVLIAMALSCSPELLIADEPTSGLDVTIQAQVLDDMKRSIEEVGSGLLIVTQDLGIVANYCDLVYVMHAGETVEQADVERFFDAPEHPASIALLAAQGQHYNHESVRLRGLPVDTRSLPLGCWLQARCPFAATESGCTTIHPELVGSATNRVRCHRAPQISTLARAMSEGNASQPPRANV